MNLQFGTGKTGMVDNAEAGELVWFLKSMRMCRFVSHDGNNLCTVEVLDSGKRMTATLDGIEPCNNVRISHAEQKPLNDQKP